MNNFAAIIFYCIMDAFLIVLALFFMSNDFTDHDNRMKENLLKTVEINGETRTIIDYSTWNDNYTLDNGATIHVRAFEKLKEKEDDNK